ncbi:MAG: lipoate--protein ligase [Halanaerobacter sp.]
MRTKDATAKLVLGTTYDPWYNLALEEYLLEELGAEEMILYLWQNDNTVVVGRNQNAWQECRVGNLEDAGGKLARRLSGGGAVFHDRGNLNYTLLMPKDLYDLEEKLGIILDALDNLGIKAEFSGRNDLVYQGKKISGNAFYYGTKGAYIHGTVLVDSDLDKLSSYLNVSDEKIRSKGIDSVQSRVMNLTEISKELTVKRVQDSIQASFCKTYNQGQALPQIEISENERIAELYDKYSAWSWRFGETPDFDISLSRRFEWGEVELNLELSYGNIESAVLYSDAMYSALIQEISESLVGYPFKLKAIIEVVKNILTVYSFPNQKRGEKIRREFIEWLIVELKGLIY